MTIYYNQENRPSRSETISGGPCKRKVYFDLYRSDLKLPVPDLQNPFYYRGYLLGLLAQQLFPGGKDAGPQSCLDFSEPEHFTKVWLDEGVKIIYDAAFFYDGVMVTVDILEHKNGKRYAYQVRSSSAVKEDHITDAALHYWVMNELGYAPDKYYLYYIDTSYVLNGKVDPKLLFKKQDITEEVIQSQNWITQNIDTFKLLTKDKQPKVFIGKHCEYPVECKYKNHCWQHISDNSVFCVRGARGKDWRIYEQDMFDLTSIPEDIDQNQLKRLEQKGQIKTGRTYVDKENIMVFLSKLSYPLQFLNFETIFPAVPVLNGMTPFQDLPYMYSMHSIEHPNAEMEHSFFLTTPVLYQPYEQDTRKRFILQLRRNIEPEGSILVYNTSLKIQILSELARCFPEDEQFIDNLINRFVDLLDVFTNAWYYKPEIGLSASIKSVLAAIAPDFSYKNLIITNRADADSIFQAMMIGEFWGDEDEARKALLEFNEKYTEAMVLIWKKLIESLS